MAFCSSGAGGAFGAMDSVCGSGDASLLVPIAGLQPIAGRKTSKHHKQSELVKLIWSCQVG